MNSFRLTELPLQELALIDFIEDPLLRNKLETIGLAEGDQISIQHRAPFGDPLIMRSETGLYSIRKEEAERIKVKKITEELCEKTKIPA